MRRLEITDLSFCETEFENSGKVQGGMLFSSFYYPYALYDLDDSFVLTSEVSGVEMEVEIMEKSEEENGDDTQLLLGDNIFGLFTMTDSGASLAATGGNGKSQFATASAFSAH